VSGVCGLTRRQAEALRFIAAENAAGRFPSALRVGRAVGAKGQGPGYNLARALSERGRVARFLTPEDVGGQRRGGLVALPSDIGLGAA
jgi:hypothetical protein